jgi:hypothetical protein
LRERAIDAARDKPTIVVICNDDGRLQRIH